MSEHVITHWTTRCGLCSVSSWSNSVLFCPLCYVIWL